VAILAKQPTLEMAKRQRSAAHMGYIVLHVMLHCGLVAFMVKKRLSLLALDFRRSCSVVPPSGPMWRVSSRTAQQGLYIRGLPLGSL